VPRRSLKEPLIAAIALVAIAVQLGRPNCDPFSKVFVCP
jgi:hypothetical protein